MEENTMQDKENLNDTAEGSEGYAEAPAENDEVQVIQAQLEELKDKYVRLVADFDNFRKRTAKERLELIQTASKDVITSLLTVLDDSERAEKQIQSANDLESIKQGITLVFNKLRTTLQARGLKAMDSVGADFNPEFHEAITEIPAPKPELVGKVVDQVDKGYYLNEKIIRFAKVVVGK